MDSTAPHAAELGSPGQSAGLARDLQRRITNKGFMKDLFRYQNKRPPAGGDNRKPKAGIRKDQGTTDAATPPKPI